MGRKMFRRMANRHRRWELTLVLLSGAVVISPSVTAQPISVSATANIDDTLHAWMSAYEYVPSEAEVRALGSVAEVSERLATVIMNPDADLVFRSRAISLSAAVGGESIHRALRQVLVDSKTAPLLKRKLALVVSDVHLPEALPVLEQLAADADPTVRESAMTGLGRLGTMEAFHVIEKRRIQETKSFVKEAADRAMLEIRSRHQR